MNESSNHQAPSSREAPNLKLQYGSIAAAFGIWSLGFLWSLVFGIWCFVLSPITYLPSPIASMNDLRFAVCLLLKNHSFTAVAVLTLALVMGEEATLFGGKRSVPEQKRIRICVKSLDRPLLVDRPLLLIQS
jgi:hypothetical protein